MKIIITEDQYKKIQIPLIVRRRMDKIEGTVDSALNHWDNIRQTKDWFVDFVIGISSDFLLEFNDEFEGVTKEELEDIIKHFFEKKIEDYWEEYKI
jgi:hypothetical protein